MTESPRGVIIGATSGIATSVARHWAETDGMREFLLVGRDQARLDAVAADLRSRAEQVQTTVVTSDLADVAAIVETCRSIADFAPTHVLVAHGNMHDQHAMQEDLALAADQLQLAGVSVVLWVERLVDVLSSGRIGVIGSVAGDRGRQSNYLYGATKAMIETASEGIQNRLHGNDALSLTLIKPGPTRSPMTAGMSSAGLADPARVAADIARGLEARRPVVYTPAKWALIMAVVRALPRPVFNRTKL